MFFRQPRYSYHDAVGWLFHFLQAFVIAHLYALNTVEIPMAYSGHYQDWSYRCSQHSGDR